jgi:hypothetical protein
VRKLESWIILVLISRSKPLFIKSRKVEDTDLPESPVEKKKVCDTGSASGEQV